MGVYGLAEKTGWEDVIMYIKKGRGFSRIAYMCVSTESYLENDLEDLENDPNEKEFVERIRKFVANSFIEADYRESNPSLILDRFINSFKIYRNCKNSLVI